MGSCITFFKLPNVVDAPGIYEQSLFQKRSQNFVSHKETIYITSHFQNRVLPGRTTLTRRVKKDMDDAFKGIGRPLTGKGLEEAFNTLAVGQPELWAVLSVETAGSGYLPDRRPRILFERHIFRRQTHWRFDDARPDLSNSKPGGYLLESHEYRRLEAALQLDRNAALSATSWGLGQVMGFNAILAGFTNTEAMVKAMVDSENAQLMGMATWIDRSGIAGSLRAHRWAEFAKAYNGPGYRKNQYDTRLAAHYQKFNLGPLPDLMVRTIQSYLVNLGYNPGIIDGILGRLTRSAIQEYQIEKGLDATGEPSLALAQHLEEELTIASDDQHKGKR
jgi:hypothetical protein